MRFEYLFREIKRSHIKQLYDVVFIVLSMTGLWFSLTTNPNAQVIMLGSHIFYLQ